MDRPFQIVNLSDDTGDATELAAPPQLLTTLDNIVLNMHLNLMKEKFKNRKEQQAEDEGPYVIWLVYARIAVKIAPVLSMDSDEDKFDCEMVVVGGRGVGRTGS